MGSEELPSYTPLTGTSWNFSKTRNENLSAKGGPDADENRMAQISDE
jgi:hypothetical protein